MSVVEWTILLVAVLVTTTLSGVLGMGGGLGLLGVMTAIMPPARVVPLHGVVQFVSNFTRMLALLKFVVWRIFAVYAVPSLLGLWAAMALWSGDKLTYLRPVVGVMLIAFLITRRRTPRLRSPPIWAYALLGVVAGFASVWIGAVGILIAPFFLRDDFDQKQVIATKAACQGISHLLKIPAFFLVGFDFLDHSSLLLGLVAVAIAGTLLGRLILEKLSRDVFVTAFEVLLGALAIWLIVGVFL